jgi:cardiolipin synthase
MRQFISRINRRDHRKLVLVDRWVTFTGSHNICDQQWRGRDDQLPWRDTSVRLEGGPVMQLVDAFERAWQPVPGRELSQLGRPLRRDRRSSPLIRLSTTIGHRRRHSRQLLARLREARNRIWITTAYFVPPPGLMRALRRAARRGVDVRILVPAQSDVVFMPWVAATFYRPLVNAGALVWEYSAARPLHAKSLIVDDWFTVGSTNLNHRSFIHDLELDVVLSRKESHAALERIFAQDLDLARCVTNEETSSQPMIARLAGHLLLPLRRWH